jgi:cytochrome c oxidase cbb3-type subunit 3
MTALRRLDAFGLSTVLMLASACAAASGLVMGAAGCEKKADAAQGRDLFATTCARCHGADGSGGLPLFDGGPAPRNFHDHAFQRERSDEQLKLTIMNGKGTGMPSFGTLFDEAQLRSLVAHVRSLDPENAK